LEKAVQFQVVIREQILIDAFDDLDQRDRVGRRCTVEQRQQIGVRISLIACCVTEILDVWVTKAKRVSLCRSATCSAYVSMISASATLFFGR
jgi:hypothetical protein